MEKGPLASGTKEKPGPKGASGGASEGVKGVAGVDWLGLGETAGPSTTLRSGSAARRDRRDDNSVGFGGTSSCWAGAGLGCESFVVAGVACCPRSQAEA